MVPWPQILVICVSMLYGYVSIISVPSEYTTVILIVIASWIVGAVADDKLHTDFPVATLLAILLQVLLCAYVIAQTQHIVWAAVFVLVVVMSIVTLPRRR